MKKIAIASTVVALLAAAAVLEAQDPPAMPAPAKEHKWLQQFAGEWESEFELFFEPGKPPLKCKGTGSARSIGGFWIVAEGKADLLGMPFTSVLTIGYDPQKKKYVGTWVDSLSSHLRKYEGTVDAKGKTLTLESEIPIPHAPGKLAKFKEVTEFKSKDHQVVTSSWQIEEGKWSTLAIVNSRRKK